MAYSGDQLQSVDILKPADTDPESSIGQEIRDLKAALLGWVDVEHLLTGRHRRPYAADAGTANAYAVTLSHVITSLDTGFQIFFKAAQTNTGASTLQVTCGVTVIGTYAIKKGGAALAAGDIIASRVVVVVFDGTNFELVNPPVATSVSGGSSGLELVIFSEGGFGTVSNTTAETTVAILNLPANDYTRILMQAQVSLRNNIAETLFITRIYNYINLLQVFNTMVPRGTVNDGAYCQQTFEMSAIFDGGQSSVTACRLSTQMGAASTQITTKCRWMRIWGIP